MRKVLLTDIDGVVLNWLDPFHEYMHDLGYERDHTAVDLWHEVHYPELTLEEQQRIISAFNKNERIGNLPSWRDACFGISTFIEHGYKIIGITALGTDPQQLDLRRKNLDSVFGPGAFAELHGTNTWEKNSKERYLMPYRGSNVPWVEDHVDNAQLGRNLGLRTFLMDHPGNGAAEGMEGITRVNNWAEIVTAVL